MVGIFGRHDPCFQAVVDGLKQFCAFQIVMTRQFEFLMLLVLSCLYATMRGGRPERIGAATLFGGACLSVILVDPFGGRFRHIEPGLLLTDVAMLGIFLWLSVRSTRFWPLAIAGLLLAEVIVHAVRGAMPNIVPKAYIDAVGFWSWCAQIFLAVGTWRHGNRVKQRSVDKPWKS